MPAEHTVPRDPEAVEGLERIRSVQLGHYPTPIEELTRLRESLGVAPRLLVKRDDAISFAFGGNKVRKLQMVLAEAQATGADTLITAGGIQSNHARVTASAAARVGLRCVLVLNGERPAHPTANALLDRLVGAEIEYVEGRDERDRTMEAVAERLRRAGRRPFVIPVGASNATGALGFVRAVGELVRQGCVPDAIVHSTSSGGTQAGLLAGCSLWGLPTRVIGISADRSGDELRSEIVTIVEGVERRVQSSRRLLADDPVIDSSYAGDGYGIPTPASRAAIELLARTEGLFLDPTYTAKAMAGLIGHLREGRFGSDETVLFWHTGGAVTLFAA